MLELITPLSYWVLVILWSIILWLYLTNLRRLKVSGGAVAVLLTLLSIDAFRTLFESAYFGLYFNSMFGLLPQWIFETLSKPSAIIIPKLVNIVAGITVLTLLIRRWIPREVTERDEMVHSLKESQSKLQESEHQFRRAVMNAPNPIMIHAEDGQVVQINSAWEKLTGYTPDDIPTIEDWTSKAYGKRMHLVRSDIDALYKADESVKEGEYPVRTKSGVTLFWDFSSAPLGELKDGRRLVISTAIDITERKQEEQERAKLENKLRQSQKMEAIGTMAGGIAHDFNNLLAIIGGNLELIQLKSDSGKPFDDNFENISQASARAKDLVAQILAFSRQEKQIIVPANLSVIVTDTLNLLRPIIPSTVEVVTESPDCPVKINADTTQLQQVLINLCSNAIHAMDDKGLLRICLEEGELTTQEASKNAQLQKRRYAKLSVADIGKGMDKETLDRIFDPFFTTKEVGKGTGMGLSVVHGIVEQHGGGILVDSTPGQGTTFTLYFPIIHDAEATQETQTEISLANGTEHVLLVDDEQYVADVCGAMLEHLGYKVTVLTSSVEALDLFKSHPDDFDLVLTDQTMPKMSGVELTKELLRIKPELPVILCSGYSAKVTEADAKELGIRAFCMKPMDMKQLASVVRDVLNTTEQSLERA
jgi:two-component system cell cycle sensor histidine kinase/response regulator CckA